MQKTIRLDKNIPIIYNSFQTGFVIKKGAVVMINFHSRKTQRIIAGVIVLFLILAMVIPMMLGM